MSANRNLKHNRRTQLDRLFEPLKAQLFPRPKGGWIREIRTLLEMTTVRLAKRVGVSQSVISNFEKSEREKTITLGSLEKVAEALECELHYLFVPKRGLEGELRSRAEALHKKREAKLEHHMRLEGQETGVKEDAWYAYELLKLYSKVWDEE